MSENKLLMVLERVQRNGIILRQYKSGKIGQGRQSRKGNKNRQKMWCCASKPQVKKALRSARQQPLQKVVLNLPPTIRLQYKKKWQGKIEAPQQQKALNEKVEQKPKLSLAKIAVMEKKLQEYKIKKTQLQQALNKQQQKGKQLQQGLDKVEAIAAVVEYMILKEEERIDGFVLKIKA